MPDKIAFIFENGQFQGVIRLGDDPGLGRLPATGELSQCDCPTCRPEVEPVIRPGWLADDVKRAAERVEWWFTDAAKLTAPKKPTYDLSDLRGVSDEVLKRLYWNAQRIADTAHQLGDEIHARESEAKYKAEIDRRGLTVGRAP